MVSSRVDSPEELIAGTRCGLIVLDAENRFFHTGQGGEELPGAWILPNLARVVTAARASDVLRVFVTVTPDEHALTGPWIRRRNALSAEVALQLDNSPWGRSFVDEAQPESDELVVRKVRTSAFFSTPLEIYLRKYGIETVVLAGVALNGAVIATLTDAVSRDFYCFVVEDAAVGTTPAMHDASLQVIGKENLISTESLCRLWRS